MTIQTEGSAKNLASLLCSVGQKNQEPTIKTGEKVPLSLQISELDNEQFVLNLACIKRQLLFMAFECDNSRRMYKYDAVQWNV